MIARFIDYLDLECRYSPNTIISYKKDLEDFVDFLQHTESHQLLENADKKMIRNFIIHLTENKISKRSINRKLSCLRSYYNFLLKIGDIKVSPVESVISLKFYPEKQIPLSPEEMGKLSNLWNHEPEILPQLIIETLYQTGIRKAELCNMILKNVDIDGREIKIIGKGNKERIIPIGDDLAILYTNYLTIRKAKEKSSDYFFVNTKGNKLNERFVYSVVNNYLSLVTVKSKKSPHILRHTFATHILENGAEISKIKKLLGHASIASTQVYTNANIDQLKKIMQNAHPRANKK